MQESVRTHKKREILQWIIALGLLALLIYLSLKTGAYNLSEEGANPAMFYITRLPRTLALILSGAGMAVSGLLIQLVSQNKYVEATTMGTIEWAGLGLLIVYIIVPQASLGARMTGAIIFSFIGTSFFFLILSRVQFQSPSIVPIVGLVVGAVVSAFTNFLSLASQRSQSIESWFQGSFAQVQVGRYEYLWIILIILVIVYLYANYLTVMGLGEAVAKNLGVNYNRIILITTILVSLMAGIVATVIGRLPFLGLMVANMVSMIKGDDVKSNLPWVTMSGMIILLACDLVSRTIIQPFELPVSLILGLLGSLAFIALILLQRRGQHD